MPSESPTDRTTFFFYSFQLVNMVGFNGKEWMETKKGNFSKKEPQPIRNQGFRKFYVKISK